MADKIVEKIRTYRRCTPLMWTDAKYRKTAQRQLKVTIGKMHRMRR